MSDFLVSARKYRPKTFDQVVGQSSVTSTLQNAIKSNQLDTGENYFTARFEDYELGFQIILFEGEEKPRMTMSKYDFKNNKFLEHYACTAVYAYID